MDINKTLNNLQKRGFEAAFFETSEEASEYLAGQIKGTSVGIGGSMTVEQLGVYPRLKESNEVHWHWKLNEEQSAEEVLKSAADAEVYITSANAVAETGEIVNIDGRGNRVASTLNGHKSIYIICGKNKLSGDFESALYRARNVAAPGNARRLSAGTPCTVGEPRCHDCSHPKRICNGLVVLWGRPMSAERVEVVLIGEELGI